MTVYILLFVANDRLNIVSHSLFQTQDSKTDWLRTRRTIQKWIIAQTTEQIFEMRATKTSKGALISPLFSLDRAARRNALCHRARSLPDIVYPYSTEHALWHIGG